MTDKRWTVRLYDAAGGIASEADFATADEAETCLADIEQIAKAAGGRVEVEGPKESG